MISYIISSLIFFSLLLAPLKYAGAWDMLVFDERHFIHDEGVLNRGLFSDDYALHKIKDEMYFETWNYGARLDKGFWFFAYFYVTNFGWGDLNCGLEFTIIEPGGKIHSVKKEFKRDVLDYSSSPFSIRVANSRAKGTHPDFQIHLEGEGIVVDMTYHSLTPGFKYGTGKIFFGNAMDDFYCLNISVPRGNVEGTFNIHGEVFDLKGHGYADHVHQNFFDLLYVDRLYGFRSFGDEVSMNLLDGYAKGKFSDQKFGSLLVTRGDRIIMATRDYKIEEGGTEILNQKSDPQITQITQIKSEIRNQKSKIKNPNYAYPTTFKITSEDKELDFRLEFKCSVKKILESSDLLENLSPPLRSAIKTFLVQPRVFRFEDEYELNVHLGKTDLHSKGISFHEIFYTNPPVKDKEKDKKDKSKEGDVEDWLKGLF